MTADPVHASQTSPPRWKIWWLGVRPRTLTLSVTPVVVGTALALTRAGAVDWTVPPVALAAAAAIQAGTNLHNDAADTLNGTDCDDRLGPPRVCASGWVGTGTVLRAAHLAFLVAVLCGIYLAWQGGLPILVLGLAAVAAGYAYSAGPWPISRTPLGEVLVLAFFGVGAVWGTAWLAGGVSHPSCPAFGAALGALAAAVLLTNNTRDLEGDRRSGRRTLAILAGRRRAAWIYAGLVLAPFGVVAAAAVVWPGLAGGALGLAALPAAVKAAGRFRSARSGADFNGVLQATARLQVVFSALVAAGLVLFPALL